MKNLLKETEDFIELSGHTVADIVFIGSEDSGHQCTWSEFKVIADIEYDPGFGAQEVAMDLIIVFSNGRKMSRDEYDGSEGWVCEKPFVMPDESLPISRLTGGGMWATVKDMQSQ